MCVPFIINQTPAAGGDHCHDPQRTALSGLWAIPSTESGPQPLLVTYNLSSLALTPGEPTPYVCMYVSMACGMYVGMCWVKGGSTQVHREGGTVSSKGKTCSVRDHDGASSQGTGSVRGCSGTPLSTSVVRERGAPVEIHGTSAVFLCWSRSAADWSGERDNT